jgi:NAD(P)-dependent dehydrogenase (short-subunit alcohol dehydrogenase family)
MRAVCLVTGISAGISKATAVTLAQRDVDVVGVVRNAERGHAAVEDLCGLAA